MRVQSNSLTSRSLAISAVSIQNSSENARCRIHTRLRNADTDRSSLQRSTRQVQGLLQPIDVVEFDVAKSLRALCHFILHNTDVGHIATREEVLNICGGRIEGKVADVRGVRRLGRKRKRLPSRERAFYSKKFSPSADAVSREVGEKSHTSRIAVETRSRRGRSRARAHGRNGYINRLDRNFQQKIKRWGEGRIKHTGCKLSFVSNYHHLSIHHYRCDLPGKGRSSISSAQEPRAKIVSTDILSHPGSQETFFPLTYSHRPRKSLWTSSGPSAWRAL